MAPLPLLYGSGLGFHRHPSKRCSGNLSGHRHGDVDVHVVDNDDNDHAKEVIQSSTSLPRGNQVDGLPRVCSSRNP